MTKPLPGRFASCEWCGETFRVKNALARFCSSRCKQRSWAQRNPGYHSAATKRWIDADPARRKAKQEYQRDYHQRPEAQERRRERARARYAANPGPTLTRGAELHASRMRFLTALKTTCGCIDCGTTEGSLHFDHRPGTVKLFNVGGRTSASFAKLLVEIEKCDVRCASCHAKRHGRERRATRVGV